MSGVVGIGETHELEGFALAGVRVVGARTADDFAAAWDGLDDDVGLVILTTAAAEQLATRLQSRRHVLTVVMS